MPTDVFDEMLLPVTVLVSDPVRLRPDDVVALAVLPEMTQLRAPSK